MQSCDPKSEKGSSKGEFSQRGLAGMRAPSEGEMIRSDFRRLGAACAFTSQCLPALFPNTFRAICAPLMQASRPSLRTVNVLFPNSNLESDICKWCHLRSS
jgi:hypothetical protein